MRLQQSEGAGRNAVYKGSTWSKDAVTHFKEVRAESTLRCFRSRIRRPASVSAPRRDTLAQSRGKAIGSRFLGLGR